MDARHFVPAVLPFLKALNRLLSTPMKNSLDIMGVEGMVKGCASSRPVSRPGAPINLGRASDVEQYFSCNDVKDVRGWLLQLRHEQNIPFHSRGRDLRAVTRISITTRNPISQHAAQEPHAREGKGIPPPVISPNCVAAHAVRFCNAPNLTAAGLGTFRMRGEGLLTACGLEQWGEGNAI